MSERAIDILRDTIINDKMSIFNQDMDDYLDLIQENGMDILGDSGNSSDSGDSLFDSPVSSLSKHLVRTITFEPLER